MKSVRTALSPGIATEALSQYVPLLGTTEPTDEGVKEATSPLVHNRGARSNAQSMGKLPISVQIRYRARNTARIWKLFGPAL